MISKTSKTPPKLRNLLRQNKVNENNIIVACETCKNEFIIETRLIHRKNTAYCSIYYWIDQNKQQQYDMYGCNGRFKNGKELIKHKMYHCGNKPSPYHNNKNPIVIDRRTYHGAGIPKTDQYIYCNKIRRNSQQTKWECRKRRLPSK